MVAGQHRPPSHGFAEVRKGNVNPSVKVVQNGLMQTFSEYMVRLSGLFAIIGFALGSSAQVDVLTEHNDNFRTGVNAREMILSPVNVNKNQFGMLFKHVVDDQLYTQPLVVTGVHVNGGTHDVVYVTTVNNSVYAFDANDPAATAPIWHVNFGAPINVNTYHFGCLDVNGQMGIVGTPVIDKTRGVLYVVALTRTSGTSDDGNGYTQRLHELDLATGADLPESPITIEAEDFNALTENQRPALMLAHDRVYVGYSSHCDAKPYHGFLLAYDAKTLKETAVFNASPTGWGASIWQSGQGPSADAEGNIYVVTGNGAWDGLQNFSESFLKLSPDLKLLDWFTPTNHDELDVHDLDLDSSGPSLIPGTHLTLGGGKQGVMYLLDTRHLGHLGDEHALEHFKATASHIHCLVYWVSDAKGPLLFVWGQTDIAKVFRFRDERLEQTPLMERDIPNQGHPGAMLSLSANGGKDGILWAAIHATGDSWHESRPGVLHAYAADNIRHELWNSLELPSRDDCGLYSKMAPPTIANGHVYLSSFGTENIGTGQLCVYGLLPSGSDAPPATPGGLKLLPAGISVTLSWAPVPGALFYRVSRSTAHTPKPTLVGMGLTTPDFTDAAPQRGDPATYTVVAVGRHGASAPSGPVTTPGPIARRRPEED